MTKATRLGIYNNSTGNGIVMRIEFLGHGYNISRNQVNGKTEAELNLALRNWLDFNEPDEIIFVHINRDGTFCLATDRLPNIWAEDEVQP